MLDGYRDLDMVGDVNFKKSILRFFMTFIGRSLLLAIQVIDMCALFIIEAQCCKEAL